MEHTKIGSLSSSKRELRGRLERLETNSEVLTKNKQSRAITTKNVKTKTAHRTECILDNSLKSLSSSCTATTSNKNPEPNLNLTRSCRVYSEDKFEDFFKKATAESDKLINKQGNGVAVDVAEAKMKTPVLCLTRLEDQNLSPEVQQYLTRHKDSENEHASTSDVYVKPEPAEQLESSDYKPSNTMDLSSVNIRNNCISEVNFGANMVGIVMPIVYLVPLEHLNLLGMAVSMNSLSEAQHYLIGGHQTSSQQGEYSGGIDGKVYIKPEPVDLSPEEIQKASLKHDAVAMEIPLQKNCVVESGMKETLVPVVCLTRLEDQNRLHESMPINLSGYNSIANKVAQDTIECEVFIKSEQVEPLECLDGEITASNAIESSSQEVRDINDSSEDWDNEVEPIQNASDTLNEAVAVPVVKCEMEDLLPGSVASDEVSICGGTEKDAKNQGTDCSTMSNLEKNEDIKIEEVKLEDFLDLENRSPIESRRTTTEGEEETKIEVQPTENESGPNLLLGTEQGIIVETAAQDIQIHASVNQPGPAQRTKPSTKVTVAEKDQGNIRGKRERYSDANKETREKVQSIKDEGLRYRTRSKSREQAAIIPLKKTKLSNASEKTHEHQIKNRENEVTHTENCNLVGRKKGGELQATCGFKGFLEDTNIVKRMFYKALINELCKQVELREHFNRVKPVSKEKGNSFQADTNEKREQSGEHAQSSNQDYGTQFNLMNGKVQSELYADKVMPLPMKERAKLHALGTSKTTKKNLTSQLEDSSKGVSKYSSQELEAASGATEAKPPDNSKSHSSAKLNKPCSDLQWFKCNMCDYKTIVMNTLDIHKQKFHQNTPFLKKRGIKVIKKVVNSSNVLNFDQNVTKEGKCNTNASRSISQNLYQGSTTKANSKHPSKLHHLLTREAATSEITSQLEGSNGKKFKYSVPLQNASSKPNIETSTYTANSLHNLQVATDFSEKITFQTEDSSKSLPKHSLLGPGTFNNCSATETNANCGMELQEAEVGEAFSKNLICQLANSAKKISRKSLHQPETFSEPNISATNANCGTNLRESEVVEVFSKNWISDREESTKKIFKRSLHKPKTFSKPSINAMDLQESEVEEVFSKNLMCQLANSTKMISRKSPHQPETFSEPNISATNANCGTILQESEVVEVFSKNWISDREDSTKKIFKRSLHQPETFSKPSINAMDLPESEVEEVFSKNLMCQLANSTKMISRKSPHQPETFSEPNISATNGNCGTNLQESEVGEVFSKNWISERADSTTKIFKKSLHQPETLSKPSINAMDLQESEVEEVFSKNLVSQTKTTVTTQNFKTNKTDCYTEYIDNVQADHLLSSKSLNSNLKVPGDITKTMVEQKLNLASEDKVEDKAIVESDDDVIIVEEGCVTVDAAEAEMDELSSKMPLIYLTSIDDLNLMPAVRRSLTPRYNQQDDENEYSDTADGEDYLKLEPMEYLESLDNETTEVNFALNSNVHGIMSPTPSTKSSHPSETSNESSFSESDCQGIGAGEENAVSSKLSATTNAVGIDKYDSAFMERAILPVEKWIERSNLEKLRDENSTLSADEELDLKADIEQVSRNSHSQSEMVGEENFDDAVNISTDSNNVRSESINDSVTSRVEEILRKSSWLYTGKKRVKVNAACQLDLHIWEGDKANNSQLGDLHSLRCSEIIDKIIKPIEMAQELSSEAISKEQEAHSKPVKHAESNKKFSADKDVILLNGKKIDYKLLGGPEGFVRNLYKVQDIPQEAFCVAEQLNSHAVAVSEIGERISKTQEVLAQPIKPSVLPKSQVNARLQSMKVFGVDENTILLNRPAIIRAKNFFSNQYKLQDKSGARKIPRILRRGKAMKARYNLRKTAQRSQLDQVATSETSNEVHSNGLANEEQSLNWRRIEHSYLFEECNGFDEQDIEIVVDSEVESVPKHNNRTNVKDTSCSTTNQKMNKCRQGASSKKSHQKL